MPLKMKAEKPMSGGKWEIVNEFNGRSHNEGGIDIEVNGGYVRRINAQNEKPDVIAKNGRVWKDIGAGAYGVFEGTLDTVTMGATDQLTDLGYTALQKAGGSTANEIREQNSIRGYGMAAGAVLGGVVSGGATTGSAVQQAAKGIGQGVSAGSPDSEFAQGVGTYLPLAGNIAGMAVGNAGYGDAIKGAKAAGDAAKAAGDTATAAGNTAEAASQASKAASQAAKAAKLTKFSNIATTASKLNKYAPIIQGAASALNATGKQDPLNLGSTQEAIRGITPYTTPGMMDSYRSITNGAYNPYNQSGSSKMDGESSSSGGDSGPVQFQQQPFYAESAANYLGKYGINV